jgi:SRSO17 transposase
VALLDGRYSTDTDLRADITETGLPYIAGIQFSTSLWPSGIEPLPLKPSSGRGHPTSAICRSAKH